MGFITQKIPKFAQCFPTEEFLLSDDSANSSNKKVPLKGCNFNEGDIITIENGVVTINESGFYRISGAVRIVTLDPDDTAVCTVRIKKPDGTEKGGMLQIIHVSSGGVGYHGLSVNVGKYEKGTEIYLYVYNTTQAKGKINASGGTYLNIEKM